MAQVFIRGLRAVTEEELLRIVEPFGTVSTIRVKGCLGFINFTNRDDAMSCIDKLNGTKIEGCVVNVSLSLAQGQGRPSMGEHRPPPRSGCFKCGGPHRASECTASSSSAPPPRRRSPSGSPPRSPPSSRSRSSSSSRSSSASSSSVSSSSSSPSRQSDKRRKGDTPPRSRSPSF